MAVVPASSAIWTGVPVVALSRTYLVRPDVVVVTSETAAVAVVTLVTAAGVVVTLVTAAVVVVTSAIDAVAATLPTDARPVSLRPTMEK